MLTGVPGSDPISVGPDAPFAQYIHRIARSHINDKWVTEFQYLLPGRFEVDTVDGQDRLNAELTALVEDGILTSDDVDGTTYYRLTAEVESAETVSETSANPREEQAGEEQKSE